jgi:hypothetical protein
VSEHSGGSATVLSASTGTDHTRYGQYPCDSFSAVHGDLDTRLRTPAQIAATCDSGRACQQSMVAQPQCKIMTAVAVDAEKRHVYAHVQAVRMRMRALRAPNGQHD